MRTHRIVPVAKPRMTQSDRWNQRPAVLRYRAFADAARASGLYVGPACGLVFYLPMPKSWGKKKRAGRDGRPHVQKPDLDNLVKSVFDATNPEDAWIWNLSTVQKRWAQDGAVVVLNWSECLQHGRRLLEGELTIEQLALLCS